MLNKELLTTLYNEVNTIGKDIKYSMNRRFFQELDEVEFISNSIRVIKTESCEMEISIKTGEATLETTVSNQTITKDLLRHFTTLLLMKEDYNRKLNMLKEIEKI